MDKRIEGHEPDADKQSLENLQRELRQKEERELPQESNQIDELQKEVLLTHNEKTTDQMKQIESSELQKEVRSLHAKVVSTQGKRVENYENMEEKDIVLNAEKGRQQAEANVKTMIEKTSRIPNRLKDKVNG